MHPKAQEFLASRIVLAAEILKLADKFRTYLERAQVEFDSYTDAAEGNRSYRLKLYMNTLLSYGREFFFALLETRVIPQTKFKQYMTVMNLVLKAKRAPTNPWTWFQKNGAILQEILVTWLSWQDKSSVQGDTLDKFAVGPFTVHNVDQVDEKTLASVRELFEKIVKLTRKSNIPRVQEVLYGDVLVMDKISTGKVLGLYRVGEDKIYVRPLAKVSHDQLQVLLHELGHRYWYKVATVAQKKKAWSVHFNYARGAEKATMPMEGDELPFKVSGLKSPTRVVSTPSGSHSTFFQVTDGTRTVKLSWKSVWNTIQRIRVEKAFPTSYAATSEEEYFSEVFALHILGKLTGEHEKLFESVLEAH